MHVRLMADYASDGVWNSHGAMIDRNTLPISKDLDGAIGSWCRDFEASELYLPAEDRTVPFDIEAFNERGARLAVWLSRELPNWTIVHQPSGR